MAAKKNAKATTKSKGRKIPEKKVTEKSAKAGPTVAKSRASAVTRAATEKPAAMPKKGNKSSLLVEFSVNAPDAQAVFLAGDFNGWLADKDKMDKGKDGIWRKKISLVQGKHEYQFVVDGNWWTDPENPSRTSNSFGSQNSVKEI